MIIITSLNKLYTDFVIVLIKLSAPVIFSYKTLLTNSEDSRREISRGGGKGPSKKIVKIIGI